MKKNSKLVHELKDLVEDHLAKYPSLTIHGFSKRCGVAASTLRRILSLETKEDPIPTTVLGITSAVTKESRIQNLLEMFDGEIRLSLMKCFQMMNRFTYCPELSEVLSNREAYIIFKLAANAWGTGKQEIIDLLGRPAIEKIDELLKLELIYSKNGRLHAKQKNFILPEEVSKSHIPELLRFTHHGSQFGVRSIFKNYSESISKEAYDEVWKVLADSSDKISAILGKKESLGEIPFFFTCILDTMEVPVIDGEGSD